MAKFRVGLKTKILAPTIIGILIIIVYGLTPPLLKSLY